MTSNRDVSVAATLEQRHTAAGYLAGMDERKKGLIGEMDGTEFDQNDMSRMGKIQEFKVLQSHLKWQTV